jgi:macrolide-specific efflux system membrane fusion protein
VLRLIEEAEIPAQEAGVLTEVAVREGQRVQRGALLAQIDDQVPRLSAEATQAQYEIARAKATNDVRIRFAKKALEVSQAELRRSTESIERFAKSVSQSQLDVEKLTVERNQLESEQATHERQLALLESKAKEIELAAARAQVARRQILAPFDGVIVQIYVRRGEWVEPGQQAVRIVNVDRLKAEGFISAAQAAAELPGKSVSLEVGTGGRHHRVRQPGSGPDHRASSHLGRDRQPRRPAAAGPTGHDDDRSAVAASSPQINFGLGISDGRMLPAR